MIILIYFMIFFKHSPNPRHVAEDWTSNTHLGMCKNGPKTLLATDASYCIQCVVDQDMCGPSYRNCISTGCAGVYDVLKGQTAPENVE